MRFGQDLILNAFGTMRLLLIAGCVQKAPQHTEKIVLGAETVAHASPVWIAESKGYFEDENQ